MDERRVFRRTDEAMAAGRRLSARYPKGRIGFFVYEEDDRISMAGSSQVAELMERRGFDGTRPIPEAEVAANGHLIAAAPDLYEALEGIVRHHETGAFCQQCGAQRDERGEYRHRFECFISPARAALAKARGE